MDAFDADSLIYAAIDVHPLGRRVRRLLDEVEGEIAGTGSVLLLPEVLSRPIRMAATRELGVVTELLGRLELHDVDRSIADGAAALGAKYRLRAADAVHLAT